jgi:hypothetical protein
MSVLRSGSLGFLPLDPDPGKVFPDSKSLYCIPQPIFLKSFVTEKIFKFFFSWVKSFSVPVTKNCEIYSFKNR